MLFMSNYINLNTDHLFNFINEMAIFFDIKMVLLLLYIFKCLYLL